MTKETRVGTFDRQLKVLLAFAVVAILSWTNTFLHDMSVALKPVKQASAANSVGTVSKAKIAKLNGYLLEHSHNPTTKEDVSSSLRSCVEVVVCSLWTIVSTLNWLDVSCADSVKLSCILLLPGQGAIFANSPPVYISLRSLLI